jgi:hypothetical protein
LDVKKLILSSILVMSLALASTAAFAATYYPEHIFGTWTVSGKLVLYRAGSQTEIAHEYQIQPFQLEIGDRPVDQVYAEYSQEQRELAYQALKAFMSVNQGNYACGDRDFNQLVQQLGRPLYLPFEQDADVSGNHRIKRYEVPNPENFYYDDHFKIDWSPGGYLWVSIAANWTENGTFWTPGITGGRFMISDDCNSASIRGGLFVDASWACNIWIDDYSIELEMVRSDISNQ